MRNNERNERKSIFQRPFNKLSSSWGDQDGRQLSFYRSHLFQSYLRPMSIITYPVGVTFRAFKLILIAR